MKTKTYDIASAIHIGGREEQQDSVKVYTLNNNHLLVVADGMGGHRGGQLASKIAVDVCVKCFQQEKGSPSNPKDFLKQMVHHASEEIKTQGELQNISPRTTLVVAIILGNHAYWAHVGDSRLYYFKQSVFSQRTRDHSVVQMLLDTDQITEEEMGTHPDQNRLLQSVGGENPPKVSLGETALEAGDALLLCSDGLWERFDIPEITKAINLEGKVGIETWPQKMVDEAAKRGGPKGDNISLAVYKHYGNNSSKVQNTRVLISGLVFLTLMLAVAAFAFFKPAEKPIPNTEPTQIEELTRTEESISDDLNSVAPYSEAVPASKVEPPYTEASNDDNQRVIQVE
ncbi:PP2C family protein-serine/threonine phosphatase [Nitrincola nitratireducens]|uniref:PPM-type phosphatase domain-containing protein n=2 Tax=Nitrincola TaxID=267849 RepID=W9UYU0_9GAMM|nr:protein phosphatase 2C domain-containing protein [Nitrincola nitratireducens]EXJ09077.1 Putative protein phosphatase 2C-type [Nitrincola nitratireducens]